MERKRRETLLDGRTVSPIPESHGDVVPPVVPQVSSETKKKQRKRSAQPERGDKTIRITEELLCILTFEKARLMRTGDSVNSYGCLVQRYVLEYLRKNEKEAYATYQTMGLIQ